MIAKIQLKSQPFKRLLIFSLFVCCSAFAEPEPPSDEDSLLVPPKPEESRGFYNLFVGSNIAISEWFSSVADGIDLFIAGSRVTKALNETSVKLSHSAYFTENEPVAQSPSFGVDLKLPNVEQYWNLKFTSYDQTEERSVQTTQLGQAPRQQNYGATLGIFQRLGNVRTAFQPRVALQQPLKISHSLSFESVADLKAYKINPKLEFYANHDKGTGIFQSLNFNFRLSERFSMTFVNEGDYQDKLNTYLVTNGVSLGQPITRRSSLSYSLYFSSNSKPHYRLTGYNFAVSWSQIIFNQILDYSITPQWGFSSASSYTGKPGLSIGMNLNF